MISMFITIKERSEYMKQIKYLILGAGPAGLAFANMLKRKKENSFLVLEKEAEAGGLCRSAMVTAVILT